VETEEVGWGYGPQNHFLVYLATLLHTAAFITHDASSEKEREQPRTPASSCCLRRCRQVYNITIGAQLGTLFLFLSFSLEGTMHTIETYEGYEGIISQVASDADT
jgi:hypothetical protein